MAGGLFARLKTWIFQEDVDYADLNGEFDNIIANLNPPGISGYSASTSQMRSTKDPGSSGSENLSVSLADEISEIRFAISRLIGGTYWYDTPAASLAGLSSVINLGGAVALNQIVSGRVSTSNQPLFIQPNGAAPTLKVLGSSTNLAYKVNGSPYTLSTDVTSSTLNLASSGNTATLTANIGAYDTRIALSGAVSAISALVGQYAVFKLGSEYFIGFVESSSVLTRCMRGIFFDSTDANIVSASGSAAATVTLMKMVWVFLDTSGVIQASYTNPAYAASAPSSPASGDYWFDFTLGKWKTYNGAAWVISNSMLIGMAVCDTANCVAAKSFDFYKSFSDVMNVGLMKYSNTEIRSGRDGYEVSVYGSYYSAKVGSISWLSGSDMDTGVTFSATTEYFLYVKDTGGKAISNIAPLDRSFDLRGWYHPAKPWRCVGRAFTDSGPNFLNPLINRELGYSGSSSTGGTTATSATDYTNLSATVVTRGRPVLLMLQADGLGSARYFYNFSSGSKYHDITVTRDGTTILSYRLNNTGTIEGLPPICLGLDINCPPGFHQYKVQAWVEAGGGNALYLDNCILVPAEIG